MCKNEADALRKRMAENFEKNWLIPERAMSGDLSQFAAAMQQVISDTIQEFTEQ